MGFFSKLFGGGQTKPAAKTSASQPKPATGKSSSDEEEGWEGLGVPQELNVHEAEAFLKGENPPVFVDVREDDERLNFGYIPGSVHIPMGELEARHGELDRKLAVVVYCASGMRSMDARRIFPTSIGCTTNFCRSKSPY